MKKLFIYAALALYACITHAQQYPEMIKVEGGTFIMGNNSSDGESDEKPTHRVTVGSFMMGKYEVTVAEYKAFCSATSREMPESPSWGWNNKHPIVNVNFDDANAYCNWLRETTGKNYRLPTEAEWEYAARGGNRSGGFVYSGTDDLEELGFSLFYHFSQTQACGGRKPNELGIYDMSGNVWEWCQDWFGDYTAESQTNPRGAKTGSYRVFRGGCWNTSPDQMRVALRKHGSPDMSNVVTGFRVVVPQ